MHVLRNCFKFFFISFCFLFRFSVYCFLFFIPFFHILVEGLFFFFNKFLTKICYVSIILILYVKCLYWFVFKYQSKNIWQQKSMVLQYMNEHYQHWIDKITFTTKIIRIPYDYNKYWKIPDFLYNFYIIDIGSLLVFIFLFIS